MENMDYIIHNIAHSHGYCASTDLYPTVEVGQWPLSIETSLSIVTKSTLTVTKRIIHLEQSFEFATEEVSC